MHPSHDTTRATEEKGGKPREETVDRFFFSVLLVWFEYLLYVGQGRRCHLSFADIVNTKLGRYAASNTTKNTSKVLTLPPKGQRYDNDRKYILNQAYQD